MWEQAVFVTFDQTLMTPGRTRLMTRALLSRLSLAMGRLRAFSYSEYLQSSCRLIIKGTGHNFVIGFFNTVYLLVVL